MDFTIFLIFIGAFLAGAVALVLVVKNFAQGFAASGKKPVLQGSLSAIIASGFAYLSTIFVDPLFVIFWIIAGIFLLQGIVHVVFFHRKYFYSNTKNKDRVLIGEILFMFALIFFVIVVFSSLEYFVKNDTQFPFFPMLMSMLAFFIPLSVYYTFDAAYSIPASIFPLWQYPLSNPIELYPEKPNEKILVIAFELCQKESDQTNANFRAKGPETMKLGDLYYHFINEYNEFQTGAAIHYVDNENSPYEWGFRIKPKWYQPQRILDPDLTLRENRIVENSVIICERI